MASGDPSPDVFVYIGHGNEQPVPYNERPKVPEGSTVVLFTEPGKAFSGTNAFIVTELMKNNPKLFENPMKHKAEIEENTGVKMRIYPEGAPMPVINYWPEGSQPNQLVYHGMSFYTSGIFKLPLPFKTLYKHDYDRMGIPVGDIAILYPGEENAELRDLIRSNPSPGNSSIIPIYNIKQIKYTTPELVTKKGTGVHYFLNCRYVENLRNTIGKFVEPIYAELAPLLTYIDPHNIYGTPGLIDARAFKRELNKIQRLNLPENRLVPLRKELVEHSGLEGDSQSSSVQTNEEFAANTIDSLNDPYTKFAILKRKYTKKFNEQFRPLQNKLKLTRQKSEEFQRGLFSPGGGAGAGSSSRKRRTRKSRTRRRR